MLDNKELNGASRAGHNYYCSIQLLVYCGLTPAEFNTAEHDEEVVAQLFIIFGI